MKFKINIRTATTRDLEALHQISRQTFYDTFGASNSQADMQQYLDTAFSKEKLLAELNVWNSAFYFALLHEEIVGYLKLNSGTSQTELKDEKATEIERIYVLKAHQGKKVGQRLYEKAKEVARGKNADFIWLGVWEKNTAAIQFYTKNGFTAFDKHIFKLGKDEQTDIMMKLFLK